MEEKINIQQNGRETTVTSTDDIKELYITFENYKVDTLKIIFKE